jgi:hypothetical protein
MNTRDGYNSLFSQLSKRAWKNVDVVVHNALVNVVKPMRGWSHNSINTEPRWQYDWLVPEEKAFSIYQTPS